MTNSADPQWIYCACGCGELIKAIGSHGLPRRFKQWHNSRGKFHYNWKGGSYVTQNGYRVLWQKNHPRADKKGYVYEHIVVMEQKLGRSLREGEVVHHINEVKTDNRPENLQLLTDKEHRRLHIQKLQLAGKMRGGIIKDMSDRFCCDCGSKTTAIHRPRKPGYLNSFTWFKAGDGKWLCTKCYTRRRKGKASHREIQRRSLSIAA